MPRNTLKMKEIEKLIGNNIRETRIAEGITTTKMAKALGVTHQQIHKYERGDNRVSASKLAIIAEMLNQPMEYFIYQKTTPEVCNSKNLRLTLSKNFAQIENKKIKSCLNDLVRMIANNK